MLTGKANTDRVKDFNPHVVAGIEELLKGADNAPVASDVRPDTNAYILYTAQRSGKRKGVIVDNENVVHYVNAFDHEFRLGPAM